MSAPVGARGQCEPEQKAKLLASDRIGGDEFGTRVAISGDGRTAIIGASEKLFRTGAAYIFRLNGSAWIEDAKLTPSDGAQGEYFGNAVAISDDGNVVIVGDPLKDDPSEQAGNAYVYRFDGSEWIEETKLIANDASYRDRFGSSVAMSADGRIVAIGADIDGTHGGYAGEAYIFAHTDDGWVQWRRIAPADIADDDHFGRSIAIDPAGRVVVVGADMKDQVGAAYVFVRDGDKWVEQAKLLASQSSRGDEFGSSVAISDDAGTIVVGAQQARDGTNPALGAAYVYRFDGSAWNEEAILRASDAEPNDKFGIWVAISGNSIVVGAPEYPAFEHYYGSAFLFRYDGSEWYQDAQFFPDDNGPDDEFGCAVSISDDGRRILVGAEAYESTGSAFIFETDCADCLHLTVRNLVAGDRAVFTVSHGRPGAKVVTVYGLRAGETVVRNLAEYCATFGIDHVSASRVIGGANRVFNANGIVSFDVSIPVGAQGRTVYFQSAQQGTCPDECMSNLVEAVVR